MRRRCATTSAAATQRPVSALAKGGKEGRRPANQKMERPRSLALPLAAAAHLEDESISGLAGRNTLPYGAAQKNLEEVARVCWNVSVCSCTTVCK